MCGAFDARIQHLFLLELQLAPTAACDGNGSVMGAYTLDSYGLVRYHDGGG